MLSEAPEREIYSDYDNYENAQQSSKSWLQPEAILRTPTNLKRPDSKAPFLCILVLFLMAAVLFIAGAYLPEEIEKIMFEDIKKELVIDSQDSPGYKRWVSSAQPDSVPMYFNFYMWNLTNSEEVLQGAKPRFVEKGPYVYRKYQVHFNVSFPDDGNRYRYKEWTYFIPVPEMSVGDPDKDEFITLNLPYVIVKANLGTKWWEELAFDLLTSKTESDLFRKLTVNQLAFGYDDPLLAEIAKLVPGKISVYPGVQPNQTSQEEANKVGFTEKKSGKHHFSEIGQFTMWHGNTSLDVWGSDWANTINGTEGFQFHDEVKEGEIVWIFVDTTMRNLQGQGDSHYRLYGLDLLRFRVVQTDLMNATQFPLNAGYYQFGPSGVINRTTTAYNAPVFLSLPHFLHADPIYRQNVIGMHPNETLHGTVLDVHVLTGTTMNAQERLQINAQISSTLLRNPGVPDVMFPIVWIEQNASITPHLAKKMRDKLDLAATARKGVLIGGYVAGGVLSMLALVGLVGVLLKAQWTRSEDYS